MRPSIAISIVLFMALLFVPASVLVGVDHVIAVNPINLGPVISPFLYGVFFEDINHAVDGGLYAELVRNRSFEHTDRIEGWSVVLEKGCKASFSIKSERPVNGNNTSYLRFDIESDDRRVILSNDGYDGIPLVGGESYIFSSFIRGDDYSGEIEIRLMDSQGNSIITASLGSKFADLWERYSVVLEVPEDCHDGRLALILKGSGLICLDMISLLPERNWHGMRPDLLEMLKELKPGFLRFPGGCLVEGDSLENSYRWKDTIGPVEERKANYNLWGYNQSYGIGFFEYLILAEYLGAEPVPIFNAGISCQVRGAEYCSMNTMDGWVQDVLDFIEFANGPTESSWGAKRAELGHPEPFNVTYIGVGNENWGNEYHERFALFQKAIKDKHPEIVILFSGPPSYEGAPFNRAWRWARQNAVEIIDEHIYAVPEWMLRNTERYDKYDREGPKVMLGEYAAHEAGRRNTLQAALAEAALMTGLERNSDVVIMAAYAPLFNRPGWSQWTPDLIWFDSTRVYGTPSYHVQRIFNRNLGDIIVDSSLTDEDVEVIGYWFKSLYHSCSFDYETGDLIIKVVNPRPEDKEVLVEIDEATKVTGKGEATVITSDSIFDGNTFEDPERIVPMTTVLSDFSNRFTFSFEGNSITVLRLNTGSL